MTDREINKAIAEHLGWKPIVKQWFCSKDGGESGWLFDEYKEKCVEYLKNIKETDWRYGSTIHPSMSLPPKYCEDLNLMHEAEKVLTDEEYFEYCRRFLPDAQNAVIAQGRTATARQRAEAFLRTLGEWKE
jgi:hypothetical protein